MSGGGGFFSRNQNAAEAASRDLVQSTLAALPGTFRQLAYLAALRDPSSGLYRHWGMENLYGAEVAQEAFRSVHRSVFSRIPTLTPETLEAEVTLFLLEEPEQGELLLEAWRRGALGDFLSPGQAGAVEAEAPLRCVTAAIAAVRGPLPE